MKREKIFQSLDGTRMLAWLMLVIFSTGILMPGTSYAGGPDQPETSSFTPIGISDMVDPFTGDFTYNIPLMDIEGYPINIAYQAGIMMEQEASWVGLGWNLNVGSVVRNMRGVPDDFNGDSIVKEMHMRPNRTYNLTGKLGFELFGKNGDKDVEPPPPPPSDADTIQVLGPPKINVSLGLGYNNYNGYFTNFSISPSFDLMKGADHDLNAGFSLSGSSENGASFAPSMSFERKLKSSDKFDKWLTGTIGSSFNSRAGLSYISYEAGLKRKDLDKSRTKIDNRSRTTKTLANGAEGSFNLGLASYSPSASHAMRNLSITGSWKTGLTLFGADGTGNIAFTYSTQWISKDNELLYSPAYGYFHLGEGQHNQFALLDFNRDNDGAFTKNTPFIASAHLTNDLYSMSAQGMSGSYRGFRSDVGYIFDPQVKTVSTSGSVGIETGVSSIAKFGMDLAYNRMSAITGGWIQKENKARDHFEFNDTQTTTHIEPYAVQEANERSVNQDPLFPGLGGSAPVYFPMSGLALSPKLDNNLKDITNTVINHPDNRRTQRYKRNQLMQFLTHDELVQGFGIDAMVPVYIGAKNHHIGEIIQTGTDGRRYVFGIAAYNQSQEEVTFATGKTINGTNALAPADYFNGLISYASASDAPSAENHFGLDNYYSSTKTPGYAHSYLLTSVLSDDYIDSDGQKGPSQNDQGSYVKFGYSKVESHKWRTPVGINQAFRNEGMKVDETDDKASFIYGKKDLWYVDTIQTKNYIAVFTTDKRLDGFEVVDRNGGLSNSNANSQRLLRKISLYTKANYKAHQANSSVALVPIQEVHFVYSYELCAGFPGNPGGLTAPAPDASGDGKLTLKQIYFTYQGSYRMKHSPYTFHYPNNPVYNMKAVDRWGNYKPTSTVNTLNSISNPLSNADFPYTDQNKANTDTWAASWSMGTIQLPSGGVINVDYESDDYAFVQHRKAMRMFPIASVEGDDSMEDIELLSVSDNTNQNRKIYFKMDPDHLDIHKYITEGEYMYFRCLTAFTDAVATNGYKYEYVSGYGKISALNVVQRPTGYYGEILLQNEKLLDNGTGSYSPIAKAGIQFGRMHLSRFVNDIAGLNDEPGDTEQGFADFIGSVANAFGSIGELFTGPNIPIYNKHRGTQILTQKSFIRLTDPTGHKLGGGLRVKSIKMHDNWDSMSGMYASEYGQEFTYENIDGTSSGVATYEPQVGGDENPFHQPVLFANKLRFAPDEKLYIEEPLMESLFPSPSVGYSRVVIRDIKPENVVRTATGKVVKEFFTAKDFPTITSATDADPKITNSFLPLLPKYQNVTVSQGFAIELNDMHGKPKLESVYPENKEKPISTVEYQYKSFPANMDGTTVSKLNNQVTVVYPNGTGATAELGVKYEAVADFRQSSTQSRGGAVQLNVNSFAAVGFFIVPTAWPSVDISSHKFRSAGFTKVINRFGILERTIANQNGSIVETSPLAYDSETGEVLLTQTTTNFNDQVYSMNYPAHWAYDQLGGAYKNIGVELTYASFNTAGYTSAANAPQHFTEGDELEIYNSQHAAKGWVSAVSSYGINVIDAAGAPITLQNTTVKVIRSGRKNKQSVSMASLTSLENPLSGLSSNKYKNVLNAGAVEFGQDWKTYCNCYASSPSKSTNPFVLGTKGNWRPVRSYTYLSGRTQSNINGNTDIRRDGVFTAYSPYYKNQSGRWKEDGLNWTYVSEVTEFSPNGMTLETKDALNRYSATTFGFNNTLTTAVAANTRLTQLAFASFEDVDYTNCADAHFTLPGTVKKTDAHTGRNSLRVKFNTPVVYTTSTSDCAVLTCADLKISLLSTDPDTHAKAFNIQNGVGPYQLDFDVLSGSADASVAGNQLFVTGNSYYKMMVTITDSKGCKLVTYVEY